MFQEPLLHWVSIIEGVLNTLRYWLPLPPPVAPSLAGWNMEPPTPGSLDHPDIGASLNEVFTPEMREKMVRLEKENEILQRRLAESDTVTREGGREGTVKNTSYEQGPVARGTGGGGREGGGEEKTVVALRKQLQEKQQRISQLEAVAQESS